MRADSYHDVTLARYEREQDKFARNERWAENRADELMKDEFNCEDPAVFLDILADAGDDLTNELKPILQQKSWNYAEIGKILCNWVEEQCIEKANQQAWDELEERIYL